MSWLEGERKVVTVLFADVVGSTELIRDLDPEEAQVILDGAVQRMIEAVHRHGGTVSRVLGDGIMALFGAPVACEDHAPRACFAALAMQEALASYAEQARRAHGVAVQVRVGLNSGEVVVRLISDDLHRDYTAMGEMVHLASRLEQLATGGATLLSAETRRLVEGYCRTRSLGRVHVRGYAEPLEVFELVGIGPLRSRLDVSAARGFSRLIGRADEMASLRAARDRAWAGEGQVVALVGEPGVGKSRLTWELTHDESPRGRLVLTCGASSFGESMAYGPIVELLRAYFHLEPGDDADAVRWRVISTLRHLDPGLSSLASPLLALLGQPIEDEAWRSLDAAQRRGRTLEGVANLLARESAVQPLLVVVENLHWVDVETEALLERLVERSTAARLLVVASYRPEYEPPWIGRPNVHRVALAPLPPASADELLLGLLGPDSSLRQLRERLVEWTRGNPFFIEECVRALVETGALRGEPGAYRLAANLPEISVPSTVQAILAARIDRLPREEKRLLRSAAVIGLDVPLALLADLMGMSEEDLREGIEHLQAAEFVFESRPPPWAEVRFKHALTHEVAYNSLLQRRRRELHRRVVEAIERVYADRLAEQTERLARHALRGEVWDRAFEYCRRAGLRALGRSVQRESVAWFEQAIATLPRLPESRERVEQAIDVRLDLRNPLQALGEYAQVVEHLRDAEALAQAIGDQRRQGRVASVLTNLLWVVGDHDAAIEAGRRALAVAEQLGDTQLRIVTNHHLAMPYRERGEYDAAMACLEWNAAYLRAERRRERFGMFAYPAVTCRGTLAWYLADLGQFGRGTELGEEAIEIARELGHPYSLTTARFNLGGLYLRQGRLEQAISALEGSMELCRTWDFPGVFAIIASRLGAAYAQAGRVAEGLGLLEQAEEYGNSRGLAIDAALRAVWLSEAHLLAGHLAEAGAYAKRAVDLARGRREPGNEAYAYYAAGQVEARRGNRAANAEGCYVRALALAERLRMLPLVAHCRRSLGDLAGQVGRLGEARVQLQAALQMYQGMSMALWASRTSAALADLSSTPGPDLAVRHGPRP